MKLVSATIEGFRCFKESTIIDFESITTFIGRNDIGKSTVCDALDAFFNGNADSGDYSVPHAESPSFSISCEFTELPESIVLDREYSTTLDQEFLLNERKNLVIKKIFSGKNPKPVEYIICKYPDLPGQVDLIGLKITELKKYAKENNVSLTQVRQTVKAEIRQAIFNKYCTAPLKTRQVAIKEDSALISKELWDKHMPLFALFKADRESSDQDVEAQDPMKLAVREALREQQEVLSSVANAVKNKLQQIAEDTVNKMAEMSPELASHLKPQISEPQWANIFKISLEDQYQVPLNKRGSGIRRLVLLNFFRAKVDRESQDGNVILAIEEPEISQHPDNQKMIMDAVKDLADRGYQIIITTHAPALARCLPLQSIRFVCKDENNRHIIRKDDDCYTCAVNSMGILANHNLKLFLGVEGPNDEAFLKNLSKALHSEDKSFPDLEELEKTHKIVFILLGGSTLQQWVTKLDELSIQELYICDRDAAPNDPIKQTNKDFADKINAQPNKCCLITEKRETENYIHHEAINDAWKARNVALSLSENFNDGDDVPTLIAKMVHNENSTDCWDDLSDHKKKEKESAAKRLLNREAAKYMTIDRLKDIDPSNFIRNLFIKISSYVN